MFVHKRRKQLLYISLVLLVLLIFHLISVTLSKDGSVRFVHVPFGSGKDGGHVLAKFLDPELAHERQPKSSENFNVEAYPNSIMGQSTLGIIPVDQTHDFWYKVFNTFKKNKFIFYSNDKNMLHLKDKHEWAYPKEYSERALLDRASMSVHYLNQMKERHLAVLDTLPDHIPQSSYVKGSKGIVYVGGRFYSWLTYLSIKMLRENGSKLPVEVVMPTIEDYEREYEYCEVTLPQVGAKCIVIPTKLGLAVSNEWKFLNFQFKPMAILCSSFEHVLYLDSDNMVVMNPDHLFNSKVYKKHGLVLWSDYWNRTISPYFYQAANIPVDRNRRVRTQQLPLVTPLEPLEEVCFHELDGAIPNYSSESGQILFNKRTHTKAMLMSLYYNIYGREIFYNLFSLGAKGTGDKETFIAGAFAANVKYYQTKSQTRTFGYFSGRLHEMAMGQADPDVDYQLYNKQLSTIKSARKSIRKDAFSQENFLNYLDEKYFGQEASIPLFAVHCNLDKIDPISYMNDHRYNDDNNRIRYRMFGNFQYKIDGEVIDFELKRWSIVMQALCIDQIQFNYFGSSDLDAVCEYILNTVEWLKTPNSTETAIYMSTLPELLV